MSTRRRAAIITGAIVILGAGLGLLWLTGASEAPDAQDAGSARGARPAAQERPRLERRPSGAYRPHRRPTSAVYATSVEDESAGAGVLEGLVLSWDTNEPIGGAELTFSHGERVSSTMSDPAGGFSFRATEPGTYVLATVTAEGFLPFAPEWGHSPIRLEARPGHRIRDIVIHLHPAVEMTGYVVDHEGRPIEGATVTLLTAQQGQTALAPLPERFTSDEQGTFRFSAMLGAVLEATHDQHAAGRARIDRLAIYHRRVTISMRPLGSRDIPTASLAGRVVDPRGRPVEGALVTARAMMRRSRGLSPPAQAVSDEAGRFELDRLDAGMYLLTATADGWAPARVRPVPTGRSDLELRLGEGATLRGVVTDRASGRPVPGFSVIVEARLGGIRRAPYRTESFFDAEGRFEMTGLETRDYEVSVTSHGYARSEPVVVTVGAAGRDVEASFSLSRGGSATGTVVDAVTGEAIPDAQIALESAGVGEDTPVPIAARTVTDYEGNFEIHGLTPGRRSLSVTARGYHHRLVTGLEVGEDGSLGPLEVELTPAAENEDPSLELTGIGAVLAPRRESLVVLRVIAGGGAAEVGLAPGDVIMAIDDASVAELGFADAVERIRGAEGTSVRLVVIRGNEDETVVTVPRRRVRSDG